MKKCRRFIFTKGRHKATLQVDWGDWERAVAHSWWMVGRPKERYPTAWVGGRHVRLHKLLLPSTETVDHVNGDTCDNRRSNLRAASRRQQCQNRKGFGKRSQFKGVYPVGKKWQAMIRINGHLQHLGMFATPETAARAYNAAARQYFGEFARPNAVT